MATDFETQFARSALRLLAKFGEQIVYKPRNGVSRVITAMVSRDGPVPLGGETMLADSVRIEVLPDPSNTTYGGIDFREIDTGGDKITIASYPGLSVDKEVAIVKVPQAEDFGLLALECK